MKKITSALIALIMTLSMMAVVNADNTPSVYVDGSKIEFGDDQEPVIVGEGTTLVPARIVFNAMGADVEWDNDLRRVSIVSKNGTTQIYITIDDPVMQVYNYTSLLDYDKTEVNLNDDAVPCIMNDRTMIPLRAISESLNAEVNWDQDSYTVDIVTAESKKVSDDDKMSVSLTSSVDAVKAGDTVDIYLNVENMPADQYISGLSAVVSYDKTAFEYTGYTLCANGVEKEPTTGADNPDYDETALKIAWVTLDTDINTDGAVMKMTFTALTDDGGDFALVNSYDLMRGYNTSLNTSDTDYNLTEFAGINLTIDIDAITVGGADAVTATDSDTEDTDAAADADATADADAVTDADATEDTETAADTDTDTETTADTDTEDTESDTAE